MRAVEGGPRVLINEALEAPTLRIPSAIRNKGRTVEKRPVRSASTTPLALNRHFPALSNLIMNRHPDCRRSHGTSVNGPLPNRCVSSPLIRK